METSEILTFLAENRLQIIAVIIIAWLIWVILYIRKKKRVAPVFAAKPVFTALPPERQLVKAETEMKRLAKENERLTLALAEYERKTLLKDIERSAEKKITAVLPYKLWLLNVENQPVGRPIYYVGGIPVIDKKAEIEKIIDESSTFKLLAKFAPILTCKLVDYLYFKGDTLYFYTAQLLPNGKWALTAISKPPKQTKHYLKLRSLTKPYILVTAAQQTIDELIANRWEVTNAKAAVHLAATVLGPFPLELYDKFKTNTGWETFESR